VLRADRSKFAELMLYLATRSQDDPHFGRTKLAVLLFHCDFGAYATFRTPITCARYRKQPLGPVADEEPDALRELETAGDVHVAPAGRWLVPLRDADQTVFTDSERALIDGVLLRHHGEPVHIGDLAGEFAGWRYATEGEEIPYYTVLIPPNGPTAGDVKRAAGGNARPGQCH
jgi:hypothetical protein